MSGPTSSERLLALINRNNDSFLESTDIVLSSPTEVVSGNFNTSVTVLALDTVCSGETDVSYQRLTLDQMLGSTKPKIYTNGNTPDYPSIVSTFLAEKETQWNVRFLPTDYVIDSVTPVGGVNDPQSDVTIRFTDHYVFHGTYTITVVEAIKPIDLTSLTLDERVSFVCASKHAFYNQKSQLEMAPVNTWPVEYIGGTPVGRHEPEPQATNYSLYTDFTTTTGWGLRNATANTTVTNPAGTQSAVVALTAAGNGLGVYQGVPAPITDFTNPAPVTLSVYLYNPDSPFYINLEQSGATPINIGAASYWRRPSVTLPTKPTSGTYYGTAIIYSTGTSKIGDRLSVWNLQRELGSKVSSPMPATSAVVTRAAAFAVIQTLGASKIQVHYTDDTFDTYDVSTVSSFQLPNAKLSWGVRYIKQISYVL